MWPPFAHLSAVASALESGLDTTHDTHPLCSTCGRGLHTRDMRPPPCAASTPFPSIIAESYQSGLDVGYNAHGTMLEMLPVPSLPPYPLPTFLIVSRTPRSSCSSSRPICASCVCCALPRAHFPTPSAPSVPRLRPSRTLTISHAPRSLLVAALPSMCAVPCPYACRPPSLFVLCPQCCAIPAAPSSPPARSTECVLYRNARYPSPRSRHIPMHGPLKHPLCLRIVSRPTPLPPCFLLFILGSTHYLFKIKRSTIIGLLVVIPQCLYFQ